MTVRDDCAICCIGKEISDPENQTQESVNCICTCHNKNQSSQTTSEVKYKRSAHLIVFFKAPKIGLLPFETQVVSNLGIYSSSDLTSIDGEIPAVVLSVEENSYEEARQKILNIVMTNPIFEWMRPWLDESYDAYAKRYALERQRRQLFQ